jgi:SAM-dependent methyltransferase
MSQVTSGLRAVLSHPLIYDTVQNIMGAQAIRRDLVDNVIRLAAGSRILDIGCGTAEILPFLPVGVEYWGYDISQEYIDAARKRFGTRGHFECRQLDQAELEKLPKFEAVIAVGVLHHLDDAVAADLFGLARSALVEDGRMITIDPCLAKGQNPIARYLILHDRGQNVRTQEGYCNLAARTFSHVNGNLRHRSWIPYTHWIMECSA